MNPALLPRALCACLGVGAANIVAINVLVHSEQLSSTAFVATAFTLQPKAEAQAPAPSVTPPVTPCTNPSFTPPSVRAPLAVVEFGRSAHWLEPDALHTLMDATPKLLAAPFVTVVGHADGSGPAELNERLSETRAQAVARRLVQTGIAAARVHVQWRGAREPRAHGENKRVEIYAGEAP